MIKKCYICHEDIKPEDSFEFKELYGYSHIDCIQARGCVVAKELGVNKFKKKANASKLSPEEQEALIEENTIDEFED